MILTFTAACPEALTAEANQLAMALGLGPDDGATYGHPGWQDAGGTAYSAVSFQVPAEWIKAAQSPLQRPEWDTEKRIDMDAATKVQASMVFSPTPVPASPDRLTAVAGGAPWEVLAAMGLSPVPVVE